jgi:RNA polymerase sigma-70 factor (ECF subfamily)
MAEEAAASLEAAFDACAESLHRFFEVRVGADRALADDLMQQLWVQAQNLGPTPEEEIEFRLRAVARNLLRSHWRRVGRRPAHVPLPDPDLAVVLSGRLVSEELPEDVLCRREVRDQLLLALTDLPAAPQELIVAHYFEGCSQAALARRLGTTPRAVEGRLYRARQALREKLRHLELD